MRFVFAMALALTLAGCATGPSLQSQMAAYIGAPETKLVQNFGVPDRQISVNGVDYLAYTLRQRSQVQPNNMFWGPRPWGAWGGAGIARLPQDIQTWSCEVTFSLTDDKVQSFQLRGNDCG